MSTHSRTAASKHTFLQHTNALLDVFPMLYAAAVDQPNPTDELKLAIAVGQRWAQQLKSEEKREMVAERITTKGQHTAVNRLADDLVRVLRLPRAGLAERLMTID